MKKISRRTFLNVMGAAGEAGALAACGGSSSGSSAAGASSAAAGGAVNGGAYAPFILTVDWLGWLCYLCFMRQTAPILSYPQKPTFQCCRPCHEQHSS